MRIYVIGPVTGHADLNRPTFESARAELSAAGHEAVIPHDFIPADAERAAADIFVAGPAGVADVAFHRPVAAEQDKPSHA